MLKTVHQKKNNFPYLFSLFPPHVVFQIICSRYLPTYLPTIYEDTFIPPSRAFVFTVEYNNHPPRSPSGSQLASSYPPPTPRPLHHLQVGAVVVHHCSKYKRVSASCQLSRALSLALAELIITSSWIWTRIWVLFSFGFFNTRFIVSSLLQYAEDLSICGLEMKF